MNENPSMAIFSLFGIVTLLLNNAAMSMDIIY
jgi:hypothetical protein